MRIVHFSWEFPPRIVGGLGTFVSELTRHLVIEGHEVIVMSMNEGNKYLTVDNWKGVEVHRPMLVNMADTLPTFSDVELRSWGSHIRFFSDILTYNVLAAAKFVNYIYRKQNRKCDIIHAHDWLGIIGGLCTKRETGIPLIFHVHSTERGRSRGLGSRTVETLEVIGGTLADMVVTVSHAMKQEIITLGIAPEDKIEVCWNGVDTSKYDPAKVPKEKIMELRRKYNIDDGEFMLLFVGRLVKVKGVDNLVEAMPLVLQKHPNVKLVILGVGELENALRERITNLGLQNKVILKTEFVSEEDRILHYAAADLCIFPSIYEPFGIVCTEAMSMSKPVIVGASGTNGLREQVIPEGPARCGLHVNGNDFKDIAWGITTILDSEDERKLMGRNARERATKYFDWKIITKKMIEIYEKCLERCKH